ncbi:MAG: YigZ family protein [Ignavibacteriaceae bacterium]|nr:YigZ family protein [Ignavibacteriaceae bacterium]
MNLPNEIQTVDDFNEVTTVFNKSSFIAQIYPVNSETGVKEYLTNAKKKYFDASHHCYAFKLADGTVRYSDAGEPNGTAGIRILNAIEHFSLRNQLIIVSRIFGGVKLGVGPLGKAYYLSAFEVINNSKISTRQLFQKATISAEYEQVSFIHRILSNNNSIILNSDYQESLTIFCLLKSDKIEQISQKLSEAGKNKIKLVTQSETVYK